MSAHRLFFLDPHGGRVLSSAPDGRDLKVLLDGKKETPDGIAVDAARGHIYWTNMGANWKSKTGSIERADLDGGHPTVIIPPGGTFTPKQIILDVASDRLYWCEREGMGVMRARLDGSHIETLIRIGDGERDRKDERNWCVGIALDPQRGQIYWTQKGPSKGGQGRIFRANIEIPAGQSPERRLDIELLYDALPEPIDLELDLANRLIYWTDRGAPPRGNTVNRAPMDGGAAPEILLDGLNEGIGLALDFEGRRMFATDIGGSVYTATLDGEGKRMVLQGQGHLTGIAYAEG